MKTISAVMAVLASAVMVCLVALPAGGQAPQTAQVTQLELAKLMVEMSGLTRFLPSNPSAADYTGLLMNNGIVPANGWVADQAVTRADLARVVLQATHQANNVPDPTNPQSWIDYAVNQGIRVDTIGLATKPLEPLAMPVGPTMFSASANSGKKPPTTVPSGDVQYGAVMQPIRAMFEPIFNPNTPTASNRGARI